MGFAYSRMCLTTAMRSAAWTLLFIPSACYGVLVNMEHPIDVPDGWTVAGPSEPAGQIELSFSVKQQNLAELHDILMSVSDPQSDAYGKHLTRDEVHKLIAPKQEHIKAVEDFIRAHGAEAKH